MPSDFEFWSLIITALAAVVPWAFSIHTKVAVIASSVESLPAMFEELRDMLEEHESRLDEHDEAIAAIRQKASPGH